MKFETFAGQIFWLAVTFVLLYVVFATIALPRLGRVIEGRATRIRSDLDEAAGAKRRSEAAIAAYEQTLAEARAKARKTGDEMRAKVQAEIDARAAAEAQRLQGDVKRAEDRIAAMRGQAMTQVSAIATDAAQALVERLGGEVKDMAQLRAAIAEVVPGGRGS